MVEKISNIRWRIFWRCRIENDNKNYVESDITVICDLEKGEAPVIYRFEDTIKSRTLEGLELDMPQLKLHLGR